MRLNTGRSPDRGVAAKDGSILRSTATNRGTTRKRETFLNSRSIQKGFQVSLTGFLAFSSSGCIGGDDTIELTEYNRNVRRSNDAYEVVSLDAIPEPAERSTVRIWKYSPERYGTALRPGMPYESGSPHAGGVRRLVRRPAARLLTFFTTHRHPHLDKNAHCQASITQQVRLLLRYSPDIAYTPTSLDAAVQRSRPSHERNLFDIGISPGDTSTTPQDNELRWYMTAQDGKHINPDSVVKDDPSRTAQTTTRRLQIRRSTRDPWYQRSAITITTTSARSSERLPSPTYDGNRSSGWGLPATILRSKRRQSADYSMGAANGRTCTANLRRGNVHGLPDARKVARGRQESPLPDENRMDRRVLQLLVEPRRSRLPARGHRNRLRLLHVRAEIGRSDPSTRTRRHPEGG
jgi:hypothetical protein